MTGTFTMKTLNDLVFVQDEDLEAYAELAELILLAQEIEESREKCYRELMALLETNPIFARCEM